MILALALLGCVHYRTYPLMSLELPGSPPLEPSGVAVLDDGTLVAVTEGDARALFSPTPDRPVRPGAPIGTFPLHDPRDDCRDPTCRGGRYRATVRLVPEPIRWRPIDQRDTPPFNVEDLAAFGPDRVIGVTEYSTIGRRTRVQQDYIVRSRRQTERLFVLERRTEADGSHSWTEVDVPEVDRLREVLSDWGRSNCDDDMLIEGLAWDPLGERVYVGLRRCDGPSQRVLRYDLGAARQGLAADIEVAADGVAGGAGPEEGISGLSFSNGRLWAVTAWDSYGYEREPAWSGRVHEVHDGQLWPVDLAGRFLDRPSGLAVLASDPDGPGLDAVVIFDDDDQAGERMRPNLTVLEARTSRPESGRYAQLVSLTRREDTPPMGLNGFDVRWWVRDHRLSQLAAALDRRGGAAGGLPSPPAAGMSTGHPTAWTHALGGLWQMTVGGTLGLWSRAFPGFEKRIGHNKQAVAYTDYAGVSEMKFTGYEAVVTVVPRDRERQNPSVARLLETAEDAYRVTVPLPTGAAPDAGLVLQGFAIDTTSRADKGICVAAMDLGVDWANAAHDAVALQTTLIGGLCNDFDARGPDLQHGRTTSVEGGARVTLQFAVVEGVPAVPWSARVFDRDVPGPRTPDGRYSESPMDAIADDAARASLPCVAMGADGTFHPLPRQPGAPPDTWLNLGTSHDGAPPPTGSLRRFQLALDPAGFDPTLASRELTEEESLNRNNYIYRYLVRVFPGLARGETLIEGGMSHGIHARGPMRDNARPSAVSLRVDVTGFAGIEDRAFAGDIVWRRLRDDPNLQPEDGFIRSSVTRPPDAEPRCSTAW